MIPVKEYMIIEFLNWIKEDHLEIESLRSISDEDLGSLCSEFLENGYINENLVEFRRWFFNRGRHIDFFKILLRYPIFG